MRRSGKGLLALGLLLILIGVAPILSAIAASTIAEAYGCTVNEAGAYPCLIGGRDWGDALATMFVIGWLMMLTIWLIPAGLVVAVFGIVRWLRKPAPEAAADPSAEEPA